MTHASGDVKVNNISSSASRVRTKSKYTPRKVVQKKQTEGTTHEKKIIIRSARLARAEEERRVSKKAWLIDSISISVNSEPIHVMSCGLTRGPVLVFLFFLFLYRRNLAAMTRTSER